MLEDKVLLLSKAKVYRTHADIPASAFIFSLGWQEK